MIWDELQQEVARFFQLVCSELDFIVMLNRFGLNIGNIIFWNPGFDFACLHPCGHSGLNGLHETFTWRNEDAEDLKAHAILVLLTHGFSLPNLDKRKLLDCAEWMEPKGICGPSVKINSALGHLETVFLPFSTLTGRSTPSVRFNVTLPVH